MRQIRLLALMSAIVVMALTGSALADSTTVNMQLTGVGGANGGGVYTYPYYFSINGGSSTSLICDAFDNEVQIGETWTANVSSLLGGGMWGNSQASITDYKAAGLIFENILGGSIDATQGNWAIWALFSPTAYNSSYFQNSGAFGIYTQYLHLAQNASDSLFSNLVLYTPNAGTQSWGGTPQEYIGIAVPEPGEYALLLTVLLFGLIVFSMKKRQSLKGTPVA